MNMDVFGWMVVFYLIILSSALFVFQLVNVVPCFVPLCPLLNIPVDFIEICIYLSHLFII